MEGEDISEHDLIVGSWLTLIPIVRPGSVSMETIVIPETSKPRLLQFHVDKI